MLKTQSLAAVNVIGEILRVVFVMAKSICL
jgi:hypothetical protein